MQAQLTSTGVENRAFAEQLARSALQASPAFVDRDGVNVVLSYGFDLGIASGWRHAEFSFDPEAVTGATSAQ